MRASFQAKLASDMVGHKSTFGIFQRASPHHDCLRITATICC